MRVYELKKFLNMFPDDMEILARSVPGDLAEPLGSKHLEISLASHDEKYGFEQSKIVINGYIPMD